MQGDPTAITDRRGCWDDDATRGGTTPRGMTTTRRAAA
jgi:hypothetical protein